MSPYRVQVLDRAFSILDALAENGPELGVSELTAQLGLSKTTVHRLLMVLEGHRYVQHSPGNTKYHLGTRLFELGIKAADKRELTAVAQPFLDRLVELTGETAHLGILWRHQVLSICAAESPKTLRTPSTVGRRTSAHSSSLGKALLAFSREEEVAATIRAHGLEGYTENTIRTDRELRQELERVRECGYAVDDEEFEKGLRCIGAPVRDESGKVVAAVSIAGPANRVGGDAMNELIRMVVDVAADLSVALGGGAN